MPRLDLSFLGPFQALLEDTPITAFESDKVRALLAYLAVEADRPHPRDALAALLWPDRPDATARKNLRQALNNLRRAIADDRASPPFLSVARDMLRFDAASDCRIDISEFERLLAQARSHRHRRPAGCDYCLVRLQAAVALYQGDFLAAFHPGDCAEFEEWALLRREAFRRSVLDALFTLAAAQLQRGEFEAARQYAHRQLELDAWREEAHRQLMLALAASGRRSAALAQFEQCRSVLQAELGVEPDEDTLALYGQIRANSFDPGVHTPPDNLPAETTSFVGREAELAQLSDYLSNPECRLVTLVGPGGIGKSRLALEAARRAGFGFADGVYFVPLAGVDAPELLAVSMAEACNIPLNGPDPPLAQLVNQLRGKELLLVLDNFEHLRAGATLLAELLNGAPGVALLVTSREALQLRAEWLLTIPGLPLPDDGDPPAGEVDALRLFGDRARQVRADFTIDPATRPAVAHICRLVDGMPLAIELAAAWARFHEPDAIAVEIQHSLDFLASQQRDAPERHRSMRAVFRHSWMLLSPEEQQVFRRITVFRGGFTAAAAGAVARADESTLHGLVDKSMLRREASGRYHVHELLRQFGAEALSATSAEERDTLSGHARYFTGFLQARMDEIQGPQQRRALQWVAADFDNVRLSWRVAADQQHAEQLDAALGSLFYFYDLRGWLREGAAAFDRAAVQLAPLAGDERVALALGRLRARQGWLTFRLGEYDAGWDLLQDGLATFRAREAHADTAFALNYLAIIARVRGEFPASRAMHEESLALYRRYGSRFDEARALNNLGIVMQDLGDYETANRLYAESLAIRRAIGDRQGTSVALTNLGVIAKLRGDFELAREYHQQCLVIDRELQDHLGIAITIHHLGEAAQGLQEFEEAERLYHESLALTREIGEKYYAAAAVCSLAEVARLQGEHSLALERFREALEIAHAIGATPLTLHVLLGIAESGATPQATADNARLAQFVLNHPAADRETREKAGRLLATLRERVPPDGYARAAAQGQAHDLDDLVQGILAAGERP